MKKISILIVIGAVLFLVIAVFLNRPTRSPTVENPRQKMENETAAATTESQKLSGASNSTENFKIIIDTRTGEYVATDKKRESVVLEDREGHVLWSTNLVERAKAFPFQDAGEIDSAQDLGTNIFVYVGKMFVYIDKESGKVIRTGAR